METGNSRVRSYYDANSEAEWQRLERHKMEWHTTWRAMVEYIPAASKVLDVGGGPGRYAVELARAGHRVTLLDLSAASVDLGRRKAAEAGVRLDAALQGDALDLGRFDDTAFDVVLLMGPLYHLTTSVDRDRALDEALRVLRPGGLLFAAFITRYAFLVDMLKHDPAAVTRNPDVIARLLDNGINLTAGDNAGFTDAYFALPAEIAPWMARRGLRQLRLAASEPLVSLVEGAVNSLPAEAFAVWADLCYRLGEDPVTWGAAEHMLYVGMKP